MRDYKDRDWLDPEPETPVFGWFIYIIEILFCAIVFYTAFL